MSTYGSSFTLAIKYDSSFQLMNCVCDDTSPFVLACHSGRIRGAFSGEGGAGGPSTSVVLCRRVALKVALADELNPLLNSVSVDMTM